MKILEGSEARVQAVSNINGCLANTKVAEERLSKACAVLDSADMVMKNLRQKYTTLHKELTNEHATPESRTAAVAQINQVIDEVAAAKADVQKAKSEHGTASKELERLREQLRLFTETLNKHLPTDLLLQADA